MRRLAFVDFDSIAQSTAAMRAFQGYVLAGHESASTGLLLDFDKDPASKRENEFQKQLRRTERDEMTLMTPLFCRFCGVDAVRVLFSTDGELSGAQQVRTL